MGKPEVAVASRAPLALPALQSICVPPIWSVDQSPDQVTKLLQRLERRYHRPIELPEVLVLRLDPGTAARRKIDEPTEYMKRRVPEVCDINWEAASVPVVDASQPKQEVAAQLKSLIWDALA